MVVVHFILLLTEILFDGSAERKGRSCGSIVCYLLLEQPKQVKMNNYTFVFLAFISIQCFRFYFSFRLCLFVCLFSFLPSISLIRNPSIQNSSEQLAKYYR